MLQLMQKNRPFRRLFCNFWSEWRDLNPRHLGPKPSALPTALHPDILLNFFCGDPTDAVCAAFLRTRPALNAQLLYIIRERNARDLSDCRQSNLYQTVDKVTIRRNKIEQRGSASEGFRMVTLGVLFTESYTAARFRMTANLWFPYGSPCQGSCRRRRRRSAPPHQDYPVILSEAKDPVWLRLAFYLRDPTPLRGSG